MIRAFYPVNVGKILLSLSLNGRNLDATTENPFSAQSISESSHLLQGGGKFVSSRDNHAAAPRTKKMLEGKALMKSLAHRVEKLFHKKEEASRNDSSSELSALSDSEESLGDIPSNLSFEEAIELLQSRNENQEMPENLPGGILLDETYVVPPKDLNMVLFAPNSEFKRNLAELQGTTDVQEEAWKWNSNGKSNLSRVVTYTKAATKLVKAVKATEQQTYIKANGNEFAVHVSVSTPDVPYGNTFKVELLYKIITDASLSSGEESSRLIISWVLNFHHSTMMKGMIENGARQGLKESFEQFSSLLSQKFKVIKAADVSVKDQKLATVETGHPVDTKSAVQYFLNFTVVSTVSIFLYIIVHIFLCEPNKLQGLEFRGLDLPDSFGEIISGGLLFIQLERVYNMVSHFVQASLQRGKHLGGYVSRLLNIKYTTFLFRMVYILDLNVL